MTDRTRPLKRKRAPLWATLARRDGTESDDGWIHIAAIYTILRIQTGAWAVHPGKVGLRG